MCTVSPNMREKWYSPVCLVENHEFLPARRKGYFFLSKAFNAIPDDVDTYESKVGMPFFSFATEMSLLTSFVTGVQF